MKRLMYLIMPLLLVGMSYAGYVQAWKVNYDTTTERATAVLKGDMYVSESTSTADADIILETGGTYPIQIYEGNLQLVTTGNGITFADGSVQTTAGVGSAFNTLSSTGTVLISADTDGSGDEPIIFKTSGNSEKARLDADGDFGIGVVDPTSRLQVSGGNNNFTYNTTGAFFRDKYNVSATGANAIIERYIGSGTLMQLIHKTNGGFLIDNQNKSSNGYIAFQSSGTERVRLTVDGNLGIGTTDPSQLLDVDGDIESTVVHTSTIQALGAGGLYILDDTGSGFNGMFVEDGGNIGIATTAPRGELEVSGDIFTSTMTRNIAIRAQAFKPASNTDYSMSSTYLTNTSTPIVSQIFYAPLYLPQGAKITSLTVYYSRNDASSTLNAYIYYCTNFSIGSPSLVTNVTATDTTGSLTAVSSSGFAFGSVDNTSQQYYVRVDLEPNDDPADCKLWCVYVTYELNKLTWGH